MVSHGAMAVQGILYSSFYRVKPWHIMVGAVWAVHNDIIDYVYMQYPVYSQLYMYIQHIKDRLLEAIDRALDEGDKDAFLDLTSKLQTLEG